MNEGFLKGSGKCDIDIAYDELQEILQKQLQSSQNLY
jgi:hypothetical protein